MKFLEEVGLRVRKILVDFGTDPDPDIDLDN